MIFYFFFGYTLRERVKKMDSNNTIQLQIPSDPNKIRGYINNLMTFLEDRIVNFDSIKYDTKVVLNEIVVNGMKHGNSFDSGKKVSVKIEVTSLHKFQITVSDEGVGFVPSVNKVDFESESGRGLFIVSKLCKSFDYCPVRKEMYIGMECQVSN